MVEASADDSVRRRRLVFRAWHRGTREMDLIMGRFADAHAASLSVADLTAFEALMEAPDPEVFGWITGTKPVPPNYDSPVFRRILSFHSVAGSPRG